MFIANLAGIFLYKDLPQNYYRFVQFKATIEKRKEIKPDDEIAVLDIVGVPETHHILFLDQYKDIEEVKEELKEAEAKVNYTTLKIIKSHLK
ncbi:MAG: DUF749 domain-containing protein [Methanobrevibacter sp.]|jgi:hypothetical protein|nr:DUF749 domain-containing protein [Candidatus Methanoflexus mossambicus]